MAFINNFDATKSNFAEERKSLEAQAIKTIHTLTKPEKVEMKKVTAYRNRLNHRKAVLEELVATEEDYLKDLKAMIEVWEPELRKSGLLPNPDVKLLFGNITQLQILSTELLEEFKKAKAAPLQEQRVGESFKQKVPFINLYIEWTVCRDAANDILLALSKNSRFLTFSEKIRHLPGVKSIDLQAYLIKPSQRIMKYPLLLKDLIKDTDTDHPDYANLVQAATEMNKVLSKVNQAAKSRQTIHALSKLQPNITWCSTSYDLVASKVFLLFHDKVECWLSKPNQQDMPGNMVYLFDIMLLNVIHKHGKYQEVGMFMLQDCVFDAGAPAMDSAPFSIKNNKTEEEMIFFPSDAHSRQLWITTISEALKAIPTAKVLVIKEPARREKRDIDKDSTSRLSDSGVVPEPEANGDPTSCTVTTEEEEFDTTKKKRKQRLTILFWKRDDEGGGNVGDDIRRSQCSENTATKEVLSSTESVDGTQSDDATENMEAASPEVPTTVGDPPAQANRLLLAHKRPTLQKIHAHRKLQHHMRSQSVYTTSSSEGTCSLTSSSELNPQSSVIQTNSPNNLSNNDTLLSQSLDVTPTTPFLSTSAPHRVPSPPIPRSSEEVSIKLPNRIPSPTLTPESPSSPTTTALSLASTPSRSTQSTILRKSTTKASTSRIRRYRASLEISEIRMGASNSSAHANKNEDKQQPGHGLGNSNSGSSTTASTAVATTSIATRSSGSGDAGSMFCPLVEYDRDDPSYKALMDAITGENTETMCFSVSCLLYSWKTSFDGLVRMNLSATQCFSQAESAAFFIGHRDLAETPLIRATKISENGELLSALLGSVYSFDLVLGPEVAKELCNQGVLPIYPHPLCAAIERCNIECAKVLFHYGASFHCPRLTTFDLTGFIGKLLIERLKRDLTKDFVHGFLDALMKSKAYSSGDHKELHDFFSKLVYKAAAERIPDSTLEALLSWCPIEKYPISPSVIKDILANSPSHFRILMRNHCFSNEVASQILEECFSSSDQETLESLRVAATNVPVKQCGGASLHRALRKEWSMCTQFLLESGVNGLSDVHGAPLLNLILDIHYVRKHIQLFLPKSGRIPMETLSVAINKRCPPRILHLLIGMCVSKPTIDVVMTAVLQNDSQSLQILAENGAEIRAKGQIPGSKFPPKTPLHHCLLNSFEECALVLLRNGAELPDMNSTEGKWLRGAFSNICGCFRDNRELMEELFRRVPALLSLSEPGQLETLLINTGKPSCLELLLELKGSRDPLMVDKVISLSKEPSHWSLRETLGRCFQVLLRFDVKPSPCQTKELLECTALSVVYEKWQLKNAVGTVLLSFQPCGKNSILNQLPSDVTRFILELLHSSFPNIPHYDISLPPLHSP
ncbi:cell division control protein 24 [Pelomyxa schiedti]|nr:cell division control protein 24 [Pelomyxa schiedti]